MLNKPFRPPLLVRKSPINQHTLDSQDDKSFHHHPAKKRRISQTVDEDEADAARALPALLKTSRGLSVPRKPLLLVRNQAVSQQSTQPAAVGIERHYNVLWRKATTKKNKTWDGDGVLSVRNGYAHLEDISGKDLGKTPWKSPLLPGSILSLGSREVEVDSAITREDFLAGRPFLGMASKPTMQEPEVGPRASITTQARQQEIEGQKVENINQLAPKRNAMERAFKTPLLTSTLMKPQTNVSVPQPRHDPKQPGAIVMKRPLSVPKGKQIVDVVVDPFLAKHLRDHQKEGVKFLYECVMGMRPLEGEGAILADEMGLGKTLQTIALLWTLLKQNPLYGDVGVIRKALIVCPVTLINNWRKEFWKWLGNERIGVFVAEGKKTRLRDFTMGKAYSVMIIGYERLRLVQEDLQKGAGIDIVIADEGHRLKTAQNKAALAIKSLNTERRIILSGTPIQNDLSEFFIMVDFVNPGLLGKYSTFKREFEASIVKSRQPGATAKEIEKGEARSRELAEITSQFILRRTTDILSKYLPPKTEYVLFCRPTSTQASVYRNVLASPALNAVLGNADAALQLIGVLKKICNSPSLLDSNQSDQDASNQPSLSVISSITPALRRSPGSSAKLQVLDSLLHRLRTTTNEKIVIVSNYTSTLDILARLLASLSYTFLRLDGSTPASKRQGLVDKFNRTDAASCFAFLLSAKSGGTGLNLTGASRLVLFDVDWNPSTDLQAMARIHRDGQRKPCRIYRLLIMGALDEKIFQRQLTKQGLADSVIDNKANAASFTKEELRDLFTLDESRKCQTHELLGCLCGGRGYGNRLLQAGDRVANGIKADRTVEAGCEDYEEFPNLPTLLKASEVNMEEQERRVSGQTANNFKAQMQVLMKYSHVDPSFLPKESNVKEESGLGPDEVEAESLVDDHVLLDVLREDSSKVEFLFAKSSI